MPTRAPEGADAPRGLVDRSGRAITYLRLAITDRCDLRCRYCRPARGDVLMPRGELLQAQEIERLTRLLVSVGVRKVRITGGEPLIRPDALPLMRALKQIPGLDALHITTNGVALSARLDEVAAIISGVNLSLDALDRGRFEEITRRDHLHKVLKTLHGLLERGVPLKINSVVLPGVRDWDLRQLVELARAQPIDVRLIEPMPFSGQSRLVQLEEADLEQRLRALYPEMASVEGPRATARLFTIPGFTGRLGLIEGHSRSFCAGCDKLRITPSGLLKGCLYDQGILDLKALLRGGADDAEILEAVRASVAGRAANGRQAEREARRNAQEPTMASIGG